MNKYAVALCIKSEDTLYLNILMADTALQAIKIYMQSIPNYKDYENQIDESLCISDLEVIAEEQGCLINVIKLV